jgi:nitrile hydratase accessory protein
LFRPENPFAPIGPTFAEPWQAQVLALAEGMKQAGLFSAGQWAAALGAALREAEAAGAADTDMTYYMAAVTALERLSEEAAGISKTDQTERKHAWEEAYEHTPHGMPVVLGAGHE